MSSLKAWIILIAILCSSAWAQLGDSRGSGLIVNADQSNTDLKNKVTILKGNVQIAFRGQYLSCDRATIDYKNQRIEALGRIRLQSATVYAEATRLVLNYNQNTATLEDGFIQSGNVVFEGKLIEKTGENTYLATEARYTACASCPPAWSFSGQRIEAELGGYAKISRPVLRVGGIPVILLPGILVPLKSARQSGFLVPSLDYSRTGGLAISQSFFWAIDRSKDFTATAKYYELRGIKGLGEYRYVLTDQSKGSLQGAYMRDRAVRNEFDIDDEIDRWYYQYSHYYALPDNFVQRASIKQISDLRYLRDFPEELAGHGDSALENKLSLTKNFHSQHLSIEASHHANLLKLYPLSENNDSVHRFPEIQYSVIEKRVLDSPLLFRFDANYVQFTRAEFSYDDLSLSGSCPGGTTACAVLGPEGQIQRDGQFDPLLDFIRTGQRADFRPAIVLPFRAFQILEVVPRIGYRETLYRFPVDAVTANSNYSRTASQRYIETDVVARTTMSHVYGDMTSAQSQRLKHEIEPEISFSNIPWIRRPDHAFFGEFAGQRYSRIYEPISDTDLFNKNRLQFDYHDRVFDKQIVDLAVTNRLVRKIWRDGFPDYERILTFRLSQSYDINESKTENPQAWSAINGLLNARFRNIETYTTAAYNPYAKVTNTSSRIKVFNDRGNFVQGSYERIYLIDEDNRVTNRNQTENLGLGIGLKARFLVLSGQIDYSAISSQILSWQYIADFKPPGDCWTIRFGHRQVIGGEPEFRFNMSFDFGGEQIKTM